MFYVFQPVVAHVCVLSDSLLEDLGLCLFVKVGVDFFEFAG